MSFQRRAFLCFLASFVLAGVTLSTEIYLILRKEVFSTYRKKYDQISTLLGKSIVELERASEDSMRNGALVVREADKREGLLSTERLKQLTKTTGLTHIFVIDPQGRFVRSTNEDPKLIPNLFSFCQKYREMFTGDLSLEVTPIIPPTPEPQPYKFLSIPNESRSRIIHVGLRFDYLNEMIRRVIDSEDHVRSVELFAPNGTSLGSVTRSGYTYTRWVDPHITVQNKTLEERESEFVFAQWVDSAHVECCQCTTGKNGRDGKYQYLIKTAVDKSEYKAVLSRLFSFLLSNFALWVLVSLVLSQMLSKFLVKRIQRLKLVVSIPDLVARERALQGFPGKDEIRELSRSFAEAIGQTNHAHKKLIQAEKDKAFSDLSLQVAHDIRSPVAALNIFLKSASGLQEDQKALVDGSIRRIKQIAEDLLNKGRRQETSSIIELKPALEAVLAEKRILVLGKKNVILDFDIEAANGLSVVADESDLARAVSNIVNNAFEALPEFGGRVTVSAKLTDDYVRVEVEDTGKGMSEEMISRIGERGLTQGKSGGHGLGLFQASRSIESWGGMLEVHSSPGSGSRVCLVLRRS